jgi:hypothetical protein
MALCLAMCLVLGWVVYPQFSCTSMSVRGGGKKDHELQVGESDEQPPVTIRINPSQVVHDIEHS